MMKKERGVGPFEARLTWSQTGYGSAWYDVLQAFLGHQEGVDQHRFHQLWLFADTYLVQDELATAVLAWFEAHAQDLAPI